MKNFLSVLLVGNFLCPAIVKAQVIVSEEPRHHRALENQYIRLLNVNLQPGDTSLFHIHKTPSVFIYLSNTLVSSQVKGEAWVAEKAVAGKTWFRSFSPLPLVHRVCNSDTGIFHVNDIELLAPYRIGSSQPFTALPWPILFENEKLVAYELKKIPTKMGVVNHRGPMVVELVSGDSLALHIGDSRKNKIIKAGAFCYIQPDNTFYFESITTNLDLVIFEIK